MRAPGRSAPGLVVPLVLALACASLAATSLAPADLVQVKARGALRVLAALKAGRAGAAIVDVVDYLQQRRRLPELQLGLSLGPALSSAWGLRKADAELRRSLDAYLAEFRKHPGWSRLLVKYFGDDAPRVLGARSSTERP